MLSLTDATPGYPQQPDHMSVTASPKIPERAPPPISCVLPTGTVLRTPRAQWCSMPNKPCRVRWPLVLPGPLFS